ncbi:MAG: hypothetical protein KDA86_19490 [Planctomycetaceae bacterium]|nr:hypothetical protein [Planctomycetaceae bacterium]
MKWHTLIVILVASTVGCSDQSTRTDNAVSEIITSDGEPVPPEVAKAMESVSREQSQGLNDAKVTVHRAYEYSGYTWLEPIEIAKLIAVDVEFRDYNQGLDLDDVDIIDGDSNENYGSDPHIASLTLDGTLSPDVDDSSWPDDLGPLRVLLIYAFPKDSKTIKLGYWGQELTPKPIPISGDGPVLPKPNPSE